MKFTLPRTLSICSMIPVAAGGWFLWRFDHCRRLAGDPDTDHVLQLIHATRAQVNLISGVAMLTVAALSLSIALWLKKKRTLAIAQKASEVD